MPYLQTDTSGLSKRKPRNQKSTPRKKVKTEHFSVNDLPWKNVSRPARTGHTNDEGIIELEEVEGIEVIYETMDSGRVARFQVSAQKETNNIDIEEEGEDEDDANTKRNELEQIEDIFTFDALNLLPNWCKYSLHPQLTSVLYDKGYTSPTPIQSAALPVAAANRDIIGIAQTGSGKTLAYGLPILHHLLSLPRPPAKERRPLRALILTPTRELALQVSAHLNAFLSIVRSGARVSPSFSTEKSGGEAKTQANAPLKVPPHVSVASIVGGMSTQKQRRVLDRGADVLVATPGRLWDIMEEDDTIAGDLKCLRFLVLDEADRMIEAGHFAELENILRLTHRESKEDRIPDELGFSNQSEEEDKTNGIGIDLQTFVFSATLSKELQRNLKKGFTPKDSKKYRKKQQPPATTLDDLLMRLDFRDPTPEVIDLSPVGGVVSTLQEGKIECLVADKDVYLYYFLLRYPGRSLVFLSSIDGIRRLLPLVELLDIVAYPLHSQLEQRQRLKNLDRFKNTSNSVLLATDIAARGLDIPAVDHVIHFQIPRSADTYIHRNGRTARAMRNGFSMLMCAPDERKLVRALLKGMGREDNEVLEMSIELSMLDKLKARVQLARQIEQSQHQIKKKNHDRKWMRATAEALEVDIDSDYLSNSEDEEKLSNQKRKAKAAKNAALKADLKSLLSQPLIARGVSTRYITSGSTPIVDDLIAGEFNKNMVGRKKADPGADVNLVQTKKRGIPGKSAKLEDEEWHGIQMQL